MAGHSKWHNIQRRKNAQDAKKGKIFMRHAKAIYTAAKQGGDINTNPALRLAVDKPNDNINRAIKKATGTLDEASYEEVTYEGYGPGGTAIIVHVLTDNRNRTAAEVRHAFSKNDGNLGETGCVSFMFDRKGYIVILNADKTIDEDELTLAAIEAGAEDIETVDSAYEIYTTPENLHTVSERLQESGYQLEESEVTLIPQSYNQLNKEDEKKMLRLVDMLEESEDVQEVHHNMEIVHSNINGID